MSLRNYFVGFAMVFMCLFGTMAGAASAQTVSAPMAQLSSPLPDFGQVNRILGQVADTGDKVLHFVSDFAPKYWEANVKQARLESFAFLLTWTPLFFFSMLILCFSVPLYFRSKEAMEAAEERINWRNKNEDARNKAEVDFRNARSRCNALVVAMSISGFIFGLTLLIGVFLVPLDYVKTQNPEFYAIQNIISELRK